MTPPKSLSPNSNCKNVHFRLCGGVSDPKTLHIYPHDTTNSITTTVKNMFGLNLHEDSALSFQDPEGRYMILQHENFEDGMTVNVRVEEGPHRYSYHFHSSLLDHLEPSARSVSPSAARGRRSASAGGRSRILKRPASSHNWEHGQDRVDRYPQDYFQQQPPQQFLPEDYEEEQRSRVEPLASAEISLVNIVEGSRRKRPKFSSDVSTLGLRPWLPILLNIVQELPLFPTPALPRNDGSTASSVSPSRPIGEVSTPYAPRNYGYPHPTPPSAYGYNTGNSSTQATSSWPQSRTNGNGTFPTPAPTIASCISDEEVAVQLMRLGRVCSATTSTQEDNYEDEAFSSDGGEFGDDGRSDTTELPDPPPGLPNSPIIYARDKMKFKSLDEILPSFDSTDPSDNDESPESIAPTQHYSYEELPRVVEQHRQQPHTAGGEDEDFDDGFDDDADETYIGKEEEDDDADYDEDLDDIPLIKTVRGRKTSSVPSGPPSNVGIGPKAKPALPKGVAKAIKRKQQPTLQTHGLKKPKHSPESQWPISPASPPSSRKPSVVSSSNGNSNKSRSNTITTLTLSTPTSLYGQQTATPVDDRPHVLGPDEPLPKPRCQRCRKSKKGCDRQRPCQRCKDAGIGADGCISEDEAGTRRGRQAAAAARKAAAGGGLGLGKLKSKTKKKKVLGE